MTYPGGIHLQRTTAEHPDLALLVDQLTRFLAVIDGDDHAFYHAQNDLDSMPYVVLGYVDGAPVACGALRPKSDCRIEIKRMFVAPDARGKGLSKMILTELESWARELGYTEAVLETHQDLEAAIGLYLGAGFEPIENYPPYEASETSRCFAKNLT